MSVPIEQARLALEMHFGYKDFRPGQQGVVQALLAGRDALAVMPTGAGKSVCYQIPGVVMSGLALVISPLVSLMGDQVRSLRDAGIQAAYLNSTLTPSQQGSIMAHALAGSLTCSMLRRSAWRIRALRSSPRRRPSRLSR